ncbi:hypothetical protein ACFL6G_09985, partial [candidate division KSB1 bacterium]
MRIQKFAGYILIVLCTFLFQAEYIIAQEKLTITHGPYLLDPAEDAITVVWFTNKPCLTWVEYSGDKSFGTFPTWGGYPKIAKSSMNGL